MRNSIFLNLFQNYSRLASIFLLCDAYDKWIERRSTELSDDSKIYYIQYQFYESLTQSFIEMFMYSMSIYVLLMCLKHTDDSICLNGVKSFISATLMGFYGNVFSSLSNTK